MEDQRMALSAVAGPRPAQPSCHCCKCEVLLRAAGEPSRAHARAQVLELAKLMEHQGMGLPAEAAAHASTQTAEPAPQLCPAASAAPKPAAAGSTAPDAPPVRLAACVLSALAHAPQWQ